VAKDSKRGRKLNYTWTLRLARIDPIGSAPPGYQSTDPKAPMYASAAFDPTCNNAKLPDGRRVAEDATHAVYEWDFQPDVFVWYHGDVGAYPGSTYGCDHTKMGARGHQGTVVVAVSDGTWTCKEKIVGSNLTETIVTGGPATCRRG